MADVCGDSCPDTLLDMCVSYCMNNLAILNCAQSSDSEDGCEADESSSVTAAHALWKDMRFPAAVSDKLFKYAVNNVEQDWDDHVERTVGVFSDPEVTPLTQVCIKRQVTFSWKHKMSHLFKHPVVNLDLVCCGHCDVLSDHIFPYIQRLRSLRVLSLEAPSDCSKCEGNVDEVNKSNLARSNGPILNMPDLQKLSLCMFLSTKNVLKNIVQPLSGLRSLNLCGSVICDRDVEYFSWIPTRLNFLVLSGVVFDDLYSSLQNITKASQLRYLDISQTSKQPKYYDSPFDCMTVVLKNLPHLVSLDISGTNLAGVKKEEPISHKPGIPEDKTSTRKPEELMPRRIVYLCEQFLLLLLFMHGSHFENLVIAAPAEHDSPKLIVSSFGGMRFEFLGLWNCPSLPFSWTEVPAKQWTSWETDEQIVYSLSVYLENAPMLVKVLGKMFSRLQQDCKLSSQGHVAVQNLVRTLQIHSTDKALLRYASACLFLTVNRRSLVLNQCIRTNMVQTLISCLNYTKDKYMAKCCLCCFLSLEMPHDALYCHRFKPYVRCLLDTLNSYPDGDFFENYGLRLLHETCRGESEEKEIVCGETETLDYLLSLIERKFTQNVCDDTMERAWSCLWSLTDDMPNNGVRFMDAENAMSLYMSCMEEFSDKAGLLKKMTGLMANLSEVEELRKKLMTQEIMTLYSSLLDSKLDGEGVSYHAASVISSMIADGPEAWTLIDPDRQDVLEKLVEAIDSWDLDSKKKIKYRNLYPIIKLAAAFDAPEAQLWAVWALCNLIRTKADRYGEMLKNEGGIPILTRIQSDPRSLQRTVELAKMTLQLCDVPKGNDSSNGE